MEPTATVTHVASKSATTMASQTTPAVVTPHTTAATPVPPPPVTTTPPPPTAAQLLQEDATKAVAYANARGYRTGIAVTDVASGNVIAKAGEADSYFLSQSTVKVLIAARLLADGKMTANEDAAQEMITKSDDDDASNLYGLVGGDAGLMSWANTYFGYLVGAAPTQTGWWGMTRVTPEGMARVLNAAYHNPAMGNWLTTQMSHMSTIADDGTNQNFGLKTVDPTAWVKQGWGGDYNATVADAASIGYVRNGKYTVAIYTQLPEGGNALKNCMTMTGAEAGILLSRV